jgi:glutathione synthase
MARAALAAGHEVHWCESSHLALFNDQVFVRSRRMLKLPKKRAPIFAAPGKDKTRPIHYFSTVLIRKDPPFDSSYITLCWMLGLAEKKVSIVNSPSRLLNHHEKLLPLQAIQAGFLSRADLLPSFVAEDPKVLSPLPKDLAGKGFVVAKPWLGYGGRSVKKYSTARAAFRKAKKHEAMIYQPYLDGVTEMGDRRVIFIDGEYCGDFVRLPKKGSFVANLVQGGRAVLRDRSPQEKEICNRIGSFLRASGILFAGVDLIGPFVTEMNITSPTGLETLIDLGGPDLGEKFIDMLENEASAFPYK